MGIRGWVYVITNRAMPGLVKVGFSTKDPMLRAQELSSTGVPHSFEVAFDALVFEARTVEQKTHAKLASFREGKEWFRCSVDQACEGVRSVAGEILLERNYGAYANVIATAEQIVDRSRPGKCSQSNSGLNSSYCNKDATTTYAGNPYCAHHASILRHQSYSSN
jgi:T5orf172 domain